MPRFAANLSMMFTEVPFLDRFEAAARVGFKAVEFQFPYEHAATDIAARLERYGLTLALFNAPPGHFANGERGIAIFKDRRAEFEAGLDVAFDYARTLKCSKLHVMAGILPSGADHAHAAETYIASLQLAANRAAPLGLDILIEPLNPHDAPGYFLTGFAQARDILDTAGYPNARLQLDLYHRQMTAGGLTDAIREFWPVVGHIQIAGVPGRHEPDAGEINYPHLFEVIDGLGYQGWIGCEYRPKAGTAAGLGWARRYGIAA